MARRGTPLVPSKREALNRFKIECAKEIGMSNLLKKTTTTTKVTSHLI